MLPERPKETLQFPITSAPSQPHQMETRKAGLRAGTSPTAGQGTAPGRFPICGGSRWSLHPETVPSSPPRQPRPGPTPAKPGSYGAGGQSRDLRQKIPGCAAARRAPRLQHTRHMPPEEPETDALTKPRTDLNQPNPSTLLPEVFQESQGRCLGMRRDTGASEWGSAQGPGQPVKRTPAGGGGTGEHLPAPLEGFWEQARGTPQSQRGGQSVQSRPAAESPATGSADRTPPPREDPPWVNPTPPSLPPLPSRPSEPLPPHRPRSRTPAESQQAGLTCGAWSRGRPGLTRSAPAGPS
ncbi:translation initiation factor IF-2-like [Dryobates pubescens]|uniref:translation initiation factor IF-2-like n=1 Tax=Dryobates pubescens TaxID=118200 RepID=UPI0023B9336E|nr:translation initiation factor IF-2-like [Dryobates pubescens]